MTKSTRARTPATWIPGLIMVLGILAFLVLVVIMYSTEFGPNLGNRTRNSNRPSSNIALTNTAEPGNALNTNTETPATPSPGAFTASNRAAIRYPDQYVIQRQTGDSIELANSQACVDAAEAASPGVIAEGCNYPAFSVQKNKISLEGTAITRASAKIGPLTGEKITDPGDENGASYIYQAEQDGQWYVFRVNYSPIGSDGVDLVISKMAESLRLPE